MDYALQVEFYQQKHFMHNYFFLVTVYNMVFDLPDLLWKTSPLKLQIQRNFTVNLIAWPFTKIRGIDLQQQPMMTYDFLFYFKRRLWNIFFAWIPAFCIIHYTWIVFCRLDSYNGSSYVDGSGRYAWTGNNPSQSRVVHADLLCCPIFTDGGI